MNERPDPLGIRLSLEVRASPEYAEHLGRSLMRIAEEHRREPNGGFNTSVISGLPPAADWASGGMLVADASAVLSEALPNGQRVRCEAALGALVIGVTMLREAVRIRGVEPMMLLLSGEDDAAEPSKG